MRQKRRLVTMAWLPVRRLFAWEAGTVVLFGQVEEKRT
jgi:hypothetical protein